jgi:DNA-directed RNA polymerase specialized sigma24 family protein
MDDLAYRTRRRCLGSAPFEGIRLHKPAATAAFLGLITKRIFIEHLRRRRAHRHGGAGVIRIPIGDGAYLEIDARSTDPDLLLAVDRALEVLRSTNPLAADVVELRFWVGLTNEEVTETLGIGSGEARSQWDIAKEKLRGILAPNGRRVE